MSIAVTDGPVGTEPSAPRVRQQARDALALMAFSAATSVGLATVLLLLTHVPGRG
jgi:hypothetical protein